jgi:hypothetical protein
MIAFSPARIAGYAAGKITSRCCGTTETHAGSFPAGDGGQSGSRSALWFLGVYGLW